jgi:hypothetical protein
VDGRFARWLHALSYDTETRNGRTHGRRAAASVSRHHAPNTDCGRRSAPSLPKRKLALRHPRDSLPR